MFVHKIRLEFGGVGVQSIVVRFELLVILIFKLLAIQTVIYEKTRVKSTHLNKEVSCSKPTQTYECYENYLTFITQIISNLNNKIAKSLSVVVAWM